MSRADDSWVIAKEVALEEGLASALPLYLQAADRFVAEGRNEQGLSLLAELLDKKTLGRKRGEAVGRFRSAVAEKFAELARPMTASANLVSSLSQLAAEFGSIPAVRLANAEKLRDTSRRGEAVEEYRRYVQAVPDDPAALAALSELLVELHQHREAADMLRHALEGYAHAGNQEALIEAARAFVERVPSARGDVLALVSKLSGADAADKLVALAGGQAPPPQASIADLEQQARSGNLEAIAELMRQKSTERASKLSTAAAWTPTAGQSSGSLAPAAAATPPAAAAVKPKPRRPRVRPGVTAAALAEFAGTKGRALHEAGDFQAASFAFERALKAEANIDVMQALMRCYHEMEREADVADLGLQLVDEQVAAGHVRSAYDTLTWLSTASGQPRVWERRAEIAALLGEDSAEERG